MIPVDPENGTFVYMGDRWTPSDLANAPYVWLPLRFGEGTTMALEWEDSWRWEDQPPQPVYTVEVALPEAVGLEETAALPRTVTLRLADGTASTREVTWEARLDRPGLVPILGTLAGGEGLTVRRQLLVVPRHMVQLVSAGGAVTDDYLALRRHARGMRLQGSVADQPYGPDPATGVRWGYEGRSKPAGSETGSMDRSLRYATDHDDLTYRFSDLLPGTYTVHAGYYDPWPWANRAAQISVNGSVVEQQRQFTGEIEAAAYGDIRVGREGEIALTLHPTRSPDIQVSWVALVRE